MASFPRSVNADYVTADEITTGGGPPALGFFPAIAAGFQYQSMIRNMYGFEEEFRDIEDEQISKIQEAGFDLAPLDASPGGIRLRDVVPGVFGSSGMTTYRPYTEFQRASYAADTYQSTNDDEGRTQARLRARATRLLEERNKIIAQAAEARPDLGIMSYDAMRAEVMRRGKEAAGYAETRGSFAANLGGFLGEMGGWMDIRTNPLAVPSLAAGGVGRSSAMRILSQFGFNAGIETVEQLSGVRENMQWFGLNPTVMDSVLQIALSGALPAGLQTLGEGLAGTAGRAAMNRPRPTMPYRKRLERWRVTPGEGQPQYEHPIGPEMPYGPPPRPERGFPMVGTAEEVVIQQLHLTPMQATRFGIDADHAARGADVWGTTPGDLLPPTRRLGTATSVIPDFRSWQGPGMDDFKPELPATWQSTARGHDFSIDEVARAMDPEPFHVIERLGAQIKEVKAQLASAAKVAKEITSAGRFGRPEIEALLREAQLALGRAKSPAGRLKAEKAIAEIEALRAGSGAVPTRLQIDALADKLAKLQAKQREAFPVAERAVAHAEGRWELADSDRDAFAQWFLNQNGIPERKFPKPPKGERSVTLTEGPSHPKEFAEGQMDVPHLRDPLAAEGPRNELPMDTVTRVSEARTTEAAELNDQWAKQVAKLLSDASEARDKGIPVEEDGVPLVAPDVGVVLDRPDPFEDLDIRDRGTKALLPKQLHPVTEGA